MTLLMPLASWPAWTRRNDSSRLPGSRIDYGMRKAGVAVARSLDSGKDMHEAQKAFELTPTAQNQMRLAHTHLEAGELALAARSN